MTVSLLLRPTNVLAAGIGAQPIWPDGDTKPRPATPVLGIQLDGPDILKCRSGSGDALRTDHAYSALKIEYGLGERLMTSGYQNDAMRIEAETFSICRDQCTGPIERSESLEQDFESALAAIQSGYSEGVYKGLRYGVTVRRSRDGKRTSLFARALAGGDLISFNLYLLNSGERSLRPCEMSVEKVVRFVRGFVPDLPKS